MANCNRCESPLPETPGGYWREPVLVCQSCGARHQREERIERLISWTVFLIVAIPFLLGWGALITTLSLYAISERQVTLVTGPLLLALLLVGLYAARGALNAIRDLSSKRNILCLEK